MTTSPTFWHSRRSSGPRRFGVGLERGGDVLGKITALRPRSSASTWSRAPLTPPGTGRTRWAMRWKPALNAFAITFGDRFPAAETY